MSTIVTEYVVTEGGTELVVKRADHSDRDIWIVSDRRGHGALFEGLEVALGTAREWARPLEQARVLSDTAREISERVRGEMQAVRSPQPKLTTP